MTVGELILELQQYPYHFRVVTPRFDEGGLDDIETVEISMVCFNNTSSHGHSGRHEKDCVHGEQAVFINF